MTKKIYSSRESFRAQYSFVVDGGEAGHDESRGRVLVAIATLRRRNCRNYSGDELYRPDMTRKV